MSESPLPPAAQPTAASADAPTSDAEICLPAVSEGHDGGTRRDMQVASAAPRVDALGEDVIVLDRRRSARRTLHVPVSVSKGPETPCPPSETVDVSNHGILVRLAVPAQPVCAGERVLVSLDLDDGALHLLGRSTRCLRGDDGRWYLAVEFDEVEPMDRSRLDQLIGSAGPLPVPLGDQR